MFAWAIALQYLAHASNGYMPNLMYCASGIKIAGTKSFRLACGQLLGFYGINIQNPPVDLLTCFCPKGPNRKLVQVDQAGAESNIVAHEAEEGLYRRIILSGIKIHAYTALHSFINHFRGEHSSDRYWMKEPAELKSLPEWKDLLKRIKSSDPEYPLGKMQNHARSYRMKWPTFQLKVLTDTEGRVVLTNEEAKRLLEVWDELFPEVLNWQNKLEDQVRKTRTLRNLFGHPREFYGRMTDALIREAISWIPQSTVGCITHYAAVKLTNYIEQHEKDWDLLYNKHDSLMSDVPDEDVEEACEVKRRFMSMELTSTTGNRFTMGADVSVGLNAGKWHETENPEGMKEV